MLFLDIHTHNSRQNKDSINILSLSLTDNNHSAVPVDRDISVGLHPWYAKLETLQADCARLKQAAQKNNVRLIGECGLDRLKGEKIEDQVIILKKQLNLAKELNMPVILHCVRCFDELMAIQKELKVSVPLIVHGFNKNMALGKQLINKGFLLSFGKAVLNPDSGAAALIKNTADFFLETDEGEVNIEEIYQATSNLKNCSLEELKALIFENWKKIKLL